MIWQTSRLGIFATIVVVTATTAFVDDAGETADPSSRWMVVCFGDSITKRGYPSILGQMLDVETTNAGVAGNTSGEGLRRMQADVLSKNPDAVVVFFGTNDLRVDATKHVPPQQYEKNLEAIIDACRKQDAEVVLCTLPPIREEAFFKRHPRELYDAAGGLPVLVSAYQQAAIRVVAKHDVTLVDLQQILRGEPSWMSADGVHPSAEGNAIIAKHIARVIAPLIGRNPVDLTVSSANGS
ncbi:Arylesterase precursor [Rubripirellula tenax]|uniref:Arylesterase n=1 Tax=Rubripirellula tenax TaxID=2528015 RepID=A0A5C6FDA2_9BACT|nr:GDSL-type esterase/lipase family protein [Rubripirellula tenax]TWU58722.1 Arylesterase precursor [Rubripirellula tenax]